MQECIKEKKYYDFLLAVKGECDDDDDNKLMMMVVLSKWLINVRS